MKISIVTVYNSYNCGSFLQAYALYRTLKKKGKDVTFLKRKTYRKNKLYSRIIFAAKHFAKGKIKRAYFILVEYFMFHKIQKKLPKTNTLTGKDLVIYGSDTIWNMEDNYFKENWERYWGVGINEKKITYAASVGSTDAEVFYQNPVFKESINAFSGISVRDEHTFEIAETLLEDDKTPQMVVDPTMLVSRDEYDNMAEKCKEKDFILLYYFGKMTKMQTQNLQAFAKENKKKIIRFGKDIPFHPSLMIAYYKKADYVITDTFHGNVFSIIFNKNFVSFGKEKKKVENLLKSFGLSDRLLDKEDNIAEIFSVKIDYNTVNEILEQKRKQSLDYLEQFLN